jgi:FkbM family methyltransferase
MRDERRVGARPKWRSRLALAVARILPRGDWQITRFAARRDLALWDHEVPLRNLPGQSIRLDLRESVSMNFLRAGHVPGTHGHDAVFRRLLRSGDTVFDVGANIGYTMMLFAAAVGGTGRVLALEPGRRAFRVLALNAEKRANAKALRVAASATCGEAVFYEAELSDISSLEQVFRAETYSVPTITLDNLAATEGAPDFVKIDVEGHEPSVFLGMAKMLGSDHPPIIVFEALTDALRDKCIRILTGFLNDEADIYRLGSDGSLADLLTGTTHDYVVVPAWARGRREGAAPGH